MPWGEYVVCKSLFSTKAERDAHIKEAHPEVAALAAARLAAAARAAPAAIAAPGDAPNPATSKKNPVIIYLIRTFCAPLCI